MNWLPVSARRLRRRGLTGAASTLGPVTVLPFFDGNGQVTRLLMLDHAQGSLLTTTVQPGRIQVSLAGGVRLDAGMALRPLEPGSLQRLAVLWHYDPWWLLADAPFAAHWSVPVLKATNAVGHLPPALRSVYYRRDLSAIAVVAMEKNGEWQVQRWKANYLPMTRGMVADARAKLATIRRRGLPRTWVLDPFWSARHGLKDGAQDRWCADAR